MQYANWNFMIHFLLLRINEAGLDPACLIEIEYNNTSFNKAAGNSFSWRPYLRKSRLNKRQSIN